MPTPDEILANWKGVKNNDFQLTIREAFDLPENDTYVYRAESFAMTLAQVQERLDEGSLKYLYQTAHQAIDIPPTDIQAYTTLFSPSASPSKSLTSFASNAKKSSPRASVSTYLLSRRLLPPSLTSPKTKSHINPYYDVWVYSCQSTGFVGPLGTKEYGDKEGAKMTHPMLPVLYHHFGCVCPSWEALGVISLLARGNIGLGAQNEPGDIGKKNKTTANGGSRKSEVKGIIDMASGSGYWTYLLRNLPLPNSTSAPLTVTAIDNTSSSWRYTWIPDTLPQDGISYLRSHNGCPNEILLMVYMITTGTFTRDILKAYKGDIVVIAGTQNENRYTGFQSEGVEEFFEREMKGWGLRVRIALPSFAGKDDALFVFVRGAGASGS